MADASLRVPFIVKQPGETGRGRRVLQPVQHIDVLPTLLDLGAARRCRRAFADDRCARYSTRRAVSYPISRSTRSCSRRNSDSTAVPLFALSSGAYRIVRATATSGNAWLPMLPGRPMRPGSQA
jgi:hypothetical protein